MEKDKNTKSDGESKNSTAIALMTQDIKYIKTDLAEIKGELKAVLGHYIQREEFNKKIEDFQNQVDKRFEGVYSRYAELENKKLDIVDFEPLKTTMRNLNWLVISTIVVGLLGLVLK